MKIKHLISLPADAPDWAWAKTTATLDQLRGTELSRVPAAGRPAAIVARLGKRCWLAATFDLEGNAEVFGLEAVPHGTVPDLPMVLSALDQLGSLR